MDSNAQDESRNEHNKAGDEYNKGYTNVEDTFKKWETNVEDVTWNALGQQFPLINWFIYMMT